MFSFSAFAASLEEGQAGLECVQLCQKLLGYPTYSAVRGGELRKPACERAHSAGALALLEPRLRARTKPPSRQSTRTTLAR